MSGVTATFEVRFRTRQPARTEKQDAAPESAPRPRRRVAVPDRLRRRLALAHYIERLIEQGTVDDYAHAARRLGVSRARISQLMDLVLLPTATQEAILMGEQQLSERAVREKWRAACDSGVQNQSRLIV